MFEHPAMLDFGDTAGSRRIVSPLGALTIWGNMHTPKPKPHNSEIL